MQLIKYIPVQLLFFLILGILSGFYVELSILSIVLLLIVFLCVPLLGYFFITNKIISNWVYIGCAYILFYFIGIASIAFQNDLKREQHYTNYWSEKGSEKVILKVNEELKSNLNYYKYVVEILRVNETQTSGKVLLNLKKDSLETRLDVDDKIFGNSRLQLVNEPKNPYQFNYKHYLEKQQIYNQIFLRSNELTKLETGPTTLKGFAHQFRVNVNKKLVASGFKGDALSILNALLLGQRQEISKELLEDYTKAGAIHILAVSGLHIGILLLLINFLLKPLDRFKNGKMLRLFISVLLLWMFAFIAGLSASVVRAVTMFTALSIGLAVRREHSVYRNLIISMFILLLINPFYLFEVGFQLSYLAIFSIVWIQPMLYRIWKPNVKLIDYFWQLLTVSVAAQLGVLPLTLYYFHQFPGLFFVANLLVIPVLGIILGTGILIILLALTSLLPLVLIDLYQKTLELLNALIAWIAAQESFLFQDIYFPLTFVIAIYLMIACIFHWVQHKTYLNLKYTLVSLILFQGIFIYENGQTRKQNEFVIFNQSRISVLVKNTSGNLIVHSSTTIDENKSALKTYIAGSNSKKVDTIMSITNLYNINSKLLLVVDSLGIYDVEGLKIDQVLLSQSPKINVQRLIETLRPDKIIADGSNYKSYVKHWEEACKIYEIPFHYTSIDGAFIEKW